MAELSAILKDPNYVNANDATKRAIFDKYSAQDPNFTEANAATQQAIRQRFGVAAIAPPSEIPAARQPSMADAYASMTRAARAQGEVGPQVLKDVVLGAVKGASQIGATLLAPIDYAARKAQERGVTLPIGRPDRRQEVTNALIDMGADPNSPFFAGGQLASEIAGTAGTGPLLAGGARVLGAAPRVVSALETAGFGRNVPMAARPVAGAVTGGAAAGLINPDEAETGALFGAGLTALPIIGKGLAAGLNYLDPNQRALGLIKQALGGDVNLLAMIRAANQAQPNALASQAAAALPEEAALKTYQALLRMAERTQPLQEASAFRAAQKQSDLSQLDAMRGGATSAEAAEARRRANANLNRVTTPMREQELAAAGIAGEKLPGLFQRQAQFSEGAAQKVADVRRFTAAGERAGARAADTVTVTGMPRVPGRYTYMGELAETAEREATRAAEGSLLFGQARDDIARQIESIKQAGLKPLTPNPIISEINVRLKDPEISTNPNASRALEKVGQMLKNFADEHGIIVPDALYAIRKNGVSAIVEDLMPNATEKARAKFAAKIVGELNPIIDRAIEEAGGTGWKAYLKTHAEGMKQIERMELIDRARDLYEKNPAAFIRLVDGNDTKTLRKIFGPGAENTDIKKVLGDDYFNLAEMAERLKTEAKITRAVTGPDSGVAALNKIIAEQKTQYRIPNLLSAKVALTNEVLTGLQGEVTAKTMRLLETASRSGADMNRLLNSMPAQDRNAVVKALSSSAIAKGVVPATVSEPNNALAPPSQNALAR